MTEAERIKDRLRACKTVEDVQIVANEERAAVQDMAKTDKTMAIQIANLKTYKLKMIEKYGA